MQVPWGRRTRWVFWSGALLAVFVGLVLTKTWMDVRPLPGTLTPDTSDVRRLQYLDRHGNPLSVTYQNPWNVHDVVPLHTIPRLLQQAFIMAEDQRFFRHHGVDWAARAQALVQNVRAMRAVRGASTITEQVVRLLHPRSRTLWSRWLEGLEAQGLERRFRKADILEFYLNQVPYGRQRRGVVQAARVYFDRDLETLNPQEILALAVLVRAPGRLDLRRDREAIRQPLARLAERLYRAGELSAAAYQQVLTADITLTEPRLPVHAEHFLRYVQQLAVPPALLQQGQLQTTLDAPLQHRAQALLESRLHDLQPRHVTDGALLVLDHQANEVLAWVSAQRSHIDAVLTPRQPGSTLKPFLYALALERGWTAATLIEDSPLAQPIGAGLHRFRNYSGQHYGAVRLRQALGNSLNVPAIRTIGFVGPTVFLERLHRLGMSSLTQPATFYGHGLALGNGEVTLFELVQAYATLARHGVWHPVRVMLSEPASLTPIRQVYSAEVSSLIANILADPEARRLEFGHGGLLHFPVETAVKTGTSSDYRDAWAVGFSHRYTVGVWMGNLQQRPMRGVSGSIGPALVLRALFAELHRRTLPQPLFFAPQLTAVTICSTTGERARADCPSMQEWFIPPYLPAMAEASEPAVSPVAFSPATPVSLRLLQPTPGLHLAMDPRLPDSLEAFPFVLSSTLHVVRVDWMVDGQLAGSTGAREYQFLWPVRRGKHQVQARVWQAEDMTPIETSAVEFLVK